MSNEMMIIAGIVVLGFLGVLGEIRAARNRLVERARNLEQALKEIRDSLKPKS